MDSTRQNKFSRLIQKELAELFQREGKSYYGNAFITLTKVKVTPDLSIARVYISIFQDKDPNSVIESLKKHVFEIRKGLGIKIKNQARKIPQLEFFLDDSLDYVEKIDKIMRTLDIPPEKEE